MTDIRTLIADKTVRDKTALRSRLSTTPKVLYPLTTFIALLAGLLLAFLGL